MLRWRLSRSSALPGKGCRGGLVLAKVVYKLPLIVLAVRVPDPDGLLFALACEACNRSASDDRRAGRWLGRGRLLRKSSRGRRGGCLGAGRRRPLGWLLARRRGARLEQGIDAGIRRRSQCGIAGLSPSPWQPPSGKRSGRGSLSGAWDCAGLKRSARRGRPRRRLQAPSRSTLLGWVRS